MSGPSWVASGADARARRVRGVIGAVAVAVVVCAVVGCSSTRYPSLQALAEDNTDNDEFNTTLAMMASQATAQGDYRIGPEDLIEVTLFDIEDHQGEPRVVPARVSNTGFVTLPYVGKTKAQGYTPIEFEDALREEYKRFIHSPQLTVLIREYRSYRVSVLGYVEDPGVIDLRGRKTLIEALAMGGGLNDDAGRSVRLTRQDDDGIQTILIDLDRIARDGDASLNLTLLPGDVITVPRAGTFYVEGVVSKPGAYPLTQDTTVSQAVATAGGADVAIANVRNVVLYRKSANGERVAMPINLASLQSGDGKQEDFLVREDDVIVVPVSGPKLFFDRVTRGVLRVGFNSTL